MKRALPCPNCGTAKLRDANGLVPYFMGLAPSAFGAPGMPFYYTCMACFRKPERVGMTIKNLSAGRLSITKREFYALPDLDAPPSPSPVVEMTPFEIQEGLKLAKAEQKERKAHFARVAAAEAAAIKKAAKPKK